MNRRLLLMPFLLSIIPAGGYFPIRAATGARYDIGAPLLTELYVSPTGSEDTTREEVCLMPTQATRYNTVIAQKAAEYGALMVDFWQKTVDGKSSHCRRI